MSCKGCINFSLEILQPAETEGKVPQRCPGAKREEGGFGNYAYMASMSASKLPVSEGNLYPGLAIRPGSAANKELTWEKQASGIWVST